MKKQLVANLLCVLIASTLAHDLLRHDHPKSHEKRIAHQNHLVRHLTQRHNDNEQCGWVCPATNHTGGGNGTGSGDIKIVINVEASIIALVNVTANLGLAIDINANLLAVFNGNDGSVIVIDLEAQSGVVITGQKSKLVWIAAEVTFEAYINSLSSLKVVLEFGLKVGTKFTLQDVAKATVELVAKVLVALGLVAGAELKEDLSNALEVLITIAGRIRTALRVGILRIVKVTVFTVRVSLAQLADYLEGLAWYIQQIRSGIELLIKHNVKFDLAIILTARSGFEVVAYLIEVQLAAGIDVVAEATEAWSLESVLSVVLKFQSGTAQGYRALIRVVILSIQVASEKVDISVLIKALIHLTVNGGLELKAKEQLQASITAIIKVLQKLEGNNKQIADIVAKLEALVANRLVISGVNISAIIDALLKVGNEASLNIVIRILVLLQQRVKLSVSISQLILIIITQLNSSVEVRYIIKLIPGLQIDESVIAEGDGKILGAILRKVNIKDILGGGLDINKILKRLPVIGSIYVAIDGALHTETNGKIELKVVIKSQGAREVVVKIIEVIKSSVSVKGSGGIHVGGGGNEHHYTIEYQSKHNHKNRHHEQKHQ